MDSNGKEIIKLDVPTTDSEKFFESIYRCYFHKLYIYSKVICNSRDLAKDVVSDLFYELWKKQTNLEDIINLETYLYVAVRNKSIKALLKDKNRISEATVDVLNNSIDYIDPEELLIEKELKETLDKIVERLPEQCQLVFRLAKERGMKYSEIAVELGISTETVKSQLKRAQKKLRAGILIYYENRKGTLLQNVRLIGQLIFFVGFNYCNIINLS